MKRNRRERPAQPSSPRGGHAPVPAAHRGHRRDRARTPRPRLRPVYTAVYTLVAFAATGLGALGAARASASSGPAAQTVSLILAIVLGLGFTVFAIVSWMSRPKDGKPATAPTWLAAIDSVTPSRQPVWASSWR
jgi:hypothetical protein